MKLYIKLLNNKPVDHPITRENMETAYPEVDLEKLPYDWAEFERVAPPQIGVYEVSEVFYEWDGNVVKDTWYVHEMGPEEKFQKQERVKRNYILDNGFSNWIFDEERCCHVTPIPMPTDGKPYKWIQEAEAWVEIKLPESLFTDRPPYPVTDPADTRNFLWNELTNNWEQMP